MAHELIDGAKDILALSLDSQVGRYPTTGELALMALQYMATVTDPAISRKLAAFWEEKFFQDMARLRVREPDTVTRVTEYVPEIVAFVDKIVKNGYAYESEGSIYFDTVSFDGADGHSYAKLEPWSKGNRELLEEGEGTARAIEYSRGIY